MDSENTPLTPRVPRHAKVQRTLSPKRVARTYTTHERRIPFAPLNQNDPLAAQLDALSLQPARSERPRFLRWVPKRVASGLRRRSSASAHAPAPAAPRGTTRRLTPALAVHRLRAAPAAHLPVDSVRQVRAALATENDVWIHAFVSDGGYAAILDRLREVLAMEWREEQHDDQLLDELVRSVVALGTHPLGIAAIAQHAPAPFDALGTLLFSPKRPADLETRRRIVQLWTLGTQLDIPLPSTAHAPSAERARTCMPSGVPYVLQLLHVAPPASDTIELVPRKARPMRPYVAELQTLCAEFFWIFCHDENVVQDYDTIDLTEAHRPRIPSGMTGSVECEAMRYATAHLELLCTLLTHLPTDAGAQLCADLRDGGMDDVLDTLRKASVEYYPALHVALAHMYAQMRAVGRDVPAAAPAAPPAPAAVAAPASPIAPAAPAAPSALASPIAPSAPAAPIAAAPASPAPLHTPLGLGRPPNPLASPCPAPVARVRITSITSERSTSTRTPSASIAPPSLPSPPPSPPAHGMLGDVTWEQIRY